MRKERHYRVRYAGTHSFTAAANTTTTVDWKITQETYNGVNVDALMDGVQYCCVDVTNGDKVIFQVVDVDNILGYGAGVVLDEFANVYAMEGVSIIKEYVASLIPNLYVRIKYVNTHATNTAEFSCNLFRHVNTEDV